MAHGKRHLQPPHRYTIHPGSTPHALALGYPASCSKDIYSAQSSPDSESLPIAHKDCFYVSQPTRHCVSIWPTQQELRNIPSMKISQSSARAYLVVRADPRLLQNAKLPSTR